MDDDIKFIDVKEFREQGFLQEANRMFFHPLGLALSIQINEDGTEEFGGIWDYREDPEGITFGEGMINKEKSERIETLYLEKCEYRNQYLGFEIQPIEEVV